MARIIWLNYKIPTQTQELCLEVGNGKGFKLLRMMKKDQYESVGENNRK